MSQTFRPYIGAEIPPLAEDLRARLLSEMDVEVAFEVLAAWLSDFAETVYKENLKLSRTRPDFENIKQQFITKLRQSNAWKDIIPAGGGETLLEFIAAIGDYGQTSILRAYDENAYDSARLTSGIYRITRTLGVHIDRRLPAQVQVSLWGSNIGDLAIPSLSQFTVGGISFFNRDTIQFDDNTESNPKIVTLYQGEITTASYTSNGAPFQSFEVGFNDYSISNEDIFCFTDDPNINYTRILDGPWHYRNGERIFWENTTPNGNVEILLGNGIYGAIPPLGSTLNFVYARNEGATVNTTSLNLPVDLISVNTVVPDRIRQSTPEQEDEIIDTLLSIVGGISISPIKYGDFEKDKEFYRHVGPSIRAANKKMVTRPDHYALGLGFPGVVDVYFQGQRELGRTNRNYINVVGVTVLKRDGTIMSAVEWADYVKYLEEREIWRVNYIRIDPEPVPLNVKGIVYVTRDSDKTNVGSFLKFRLAEFFKIQRGSLGRSVYRNDIEDIMKFKYGSMNVDYAQVINPKIDTILTKLQYPVLGTPEITVEYSDRSFNIIPPRIVGSSINAP